MNEKHYWKIGILVVCMAICFGPFNSYGADKEVVYLSLADYTGPSGGLDNFIQQGTEDYFKYVNDQGGINGVKIKFIGVDTRADVARVVSAYKRYIRTPKVLAFWNNSTPSNKVMIPLATRDKIVMITPASGEAVAFPGNVFTWGQTYQDGFAACIDWAIEDWEKKGNKDKPTMGYMGLDNSYGHAHMQGGQEYAKMKGVELSTEFFNVGVSDYTTYLTRLKECDYIFVGGIDPNPTNVIRDAHRLGMTKNTQFICDYWGPSRGSNMGIAAHPEVLQGVVVVSFVLRGRDITEHPLATKIWTQYRKKSVDELLGLYAGGFTMAMAYVEALKIALDEVGYEELDSMDMFEAYQKLTGNKFAQGIQTECTYSSTERRGSKGIRFYRVKENDLIPISDWIIPPDAVSLHKW